MQLDLPFNRPRPRPWLGWALLVAGLALAVEMGVSYQRVVSEIETQEAKRPADKTRKTVARISSTQKDDLALQAEIMRANAVMDDLARPWDSLFEALESVDFDRVALLSIQPDTDGRLLTLTGEAKGYADLLTYVARLRDKPVFSSVVLASHEVREDDPLRPYLFTTRANWQVRP